MKYSAKVKDCSAIYNAIKALKVDEVLEVTYGTDYKGEPKVYTIKAYSGYKGKVDYAIHSDVFNGMNISKVGKTSMNAYSYDMMFQKTTYRFQFSKMTIGLTINEKEEEVAA